MNINVNDLPPLSECEFTKDMIFVDLETSGFQSAIPDACVLSIGAVLLSKEGEIVSEFSGTICPTEDLIEKMSPGAMAVNGLTPEILRETGKPREEVWSAFADWLKEHKVTATKTRFVGQNPGFDLAFIEAEMPTLTRKYGWVKDRATDVIELYQTAESKFIVPPVGKGRKGKNGKALSLALDVEPEPDVHDALEGARVVFRNFTRIMQRVKYWKDHGEKL